MIFTKFLNFDKGISIVFVLIDASATVIKAVPALARLLHTGRRIVHTASKRRDSGQLGIDKGLGWLSLASE